MLGRVVGVAGVDNYLSLLARLAPEGAEDHSPGVEDGEGSADVTGDVETPVPAAARAHFKQQRVLREEAGEEREGREREAAGEEAAERERQSFAEAAHVVERLVAAHRRDHRAGGHKEQRLEEGVGHHVEEAADVGGGADAHNHVTDLRHRRVGDHALEVGHHEADAAGYQQRQRTDDRADRCRRWRPLEEHVEAADQIDASGDHCCGVDQRADRCWAFHRVGEPSLERNLRRLGEGADEDQQHRDHQLRRILLKGCVGAGEELAVVEHAHRLEEEERSEHEADVADDVDHEGLDAGRRGRVAAVPVGDQHVGGGANEGPANDQQHHVAREHQQQHREDEEVEVREVANVTLVGLHVASRVEVDQRRDAGHDEDHEGRERIDVETKLNLYAVNVDQIPERGRFNARVVRQRLQLDQRQHREDEGQRDRQRADRPSSARRELLAKQRDRQHARQRAGQDQPWRHGETHPCSSLSSSTSTGKRRR